MKGVRLRRFWDDLTQSSYSQTLLGNALVGAIPLPRLPRLFFLGLCFCWLEATLKADDALYSNPYRNIPVEKASSLLIGLWGDDNKLINAVKIEDSNLVRNIFRQIKTSAPEKSKLYTYADYTVALLSG